MALSYDSNWDACQQYSSDAHTQTNAQLSWELQDFSHNLDLPDNSFNSVLFYSSENYNSLVPAFRTPVSDDINLSNCASIMQAPAVPFQEFDPLMYCPKRQKAAYIDYEEIYHRAIYNLQDYNSQEVVIPPLLDFPTGPPVYSGRIRCEGSTKNSLSAQSIAARQRRRKITDKTRELGKLIPGGHKMNTAEMFQAAYKYIKFLQAQVGILQLEKSYDHKESEESSVQSEDLHGLLESPLIQEQLYSTDKCLVPQKFVRSLRNDEKKMQSIVPANQDGRHVGIDKISHDQVEESSNKSWRTESPNSRMWQNFGRRRPIQIGSTRSIYYFQSQDML